MSKKDKKAEMKKVETQEPTPEIKTEIKEPDPVVETKATKPDFPAGFCLSEADWASSERHYDAASTSCQQCGKDPALKGTFDTCILRDRFLADQGAKGAKKVAGTRKAKEPGKPTQGDVINGFIKASKPLSEIAAEIAPMYYGGNVKAALGRVKRHVYAGIIQGGSSCSKEMLPFVGYLQAKAPEPEKKEANA